MYFFGWYVHPSAASYAMAYILYQPEIFLL